MSRNNHHVVIVGGGFAGLSAARALKRAPCRVTLIDRRNFHLFQPLLYQVATGSLSPANIASPLRKVLKSQANADVLLGEVQAFDPVAGRVILSDGTVSYDTLVVAAGMRNHYFGHDEWEAVSPGLKTVEDATEIRRRIFLAFEAAEREPDPQRVEALLTFVVVGAGPTGVELVGALSEIAHDTLKGNFRHIDPDKARILLLEGSPRVLSMFPEDLSHKAAAQLERRGIELMTSTFVTHIAPGSVTVRQGERVSSIPTRTVIWAAGVAPSPLAAELRRAFGAELDSRGRVKVQPDCSLAGHPEVLVIGDMASFSHRGGDPLPGMAPVASQQGRYVGRLVRRRLGARPCPPFRYFDAGSMAVIGRGSAVAHVFSLRFGGRLAWLTWLLIHLMYIVEYGNRVLIFLQWAFNYFTFNRAARLITGKAPFPLTVGDDPPRGSDLRSS